MKESLPHSQFLHQQILDAYEEKHSKCFQNKRRRGINPSQTKRQAIDSLHKCMPDLSQKLQAQDSYPFSAFGIVQSLFKGQKRRAIGAIIHKNLVISSSSVLQTFSENNHQICFIPFSKKKGQKFQARKTHPRIRNRDDGSNKNGQLNINTMCIILQLDKKVNLQAQYGSFGINFASQLVHMKQSSFIGIFQQEGQYRLCQETVNITNSKEIITYNLHKQYLPGSLIVNNQAGEYQIIGFHTFCKQNKGEGLYLTKDVWSQFQKMTFKQGELNLSHENVGRKGVNFISQLNLKRLKHLQLQNSSIGNQQVRLISHLNCELTSIYLGYNKIRDDDLHHLKNTQWQLDRISLTKNLITFQTIKTLSAMKWRNMTHLELNQNTIGSKGASLLSQCDWKNLATLNLSRAEIDDAACDKLRKGRWPHLTILELDRNKINLKGVRHLANSNWKELQNLSIASNHLLHEGVKQIILGNWIKIKSLRVQKNSVGKKVSELKNWIQDKFKSIFIVI